MLKLENVQVKYDDFIAVDNINFEVKDGTFFTLLGPSGCGKTTTLRSIAGFVQPSKGSIYLDGQDITNLPVEKRNIGMVFQSYALFPTMSVYENIAFSLRVEKRSKQEVDRRVYEIAELVELNEDQLNRNVAELSGGQQQRVAIARALANERTTVLFDEPLSNLDAKLRKQLRAELKRIQRSAGMTSVYVTHDQEEALTMSDLIAVFNNGFIEQIGTPEEIYNESASEFVCNFIGEANPLTDQFIAKFNENSKVPLLEGAISYIRVEKIKTRQVAGGDYVVPIEASVIGREFYGTYSVYTFQVGDSQLKSIEKEDNNTDFDIGDTTSIYIAPNDVLQYDKEERKLIV